MNQRVMIAMAIACNPRLLIADEPTTALDVTIQAQILDLLRGLQRERGMALVLVTHNMGVGRRNGPPRRGDVCRAGGRGARRRRALRARRSTPTRRRCSRRCPSAAAASGASRPFPGMVPGLYDRPRRLPLRAAVHLRHRPLVPRASGAAALGRWRRALPLSAGRPRPRGSARPRPPAREARRMSAGGRACRARVSPRRERAAPRGDARSPKRTTCGRSTRFRAGRCASPPACTRSAACPSPSRPAARSRSSANRAAASRRSRGSSR